MYKRSNEKLISETTCPPHIQMEFFQDFQFSKFLNYQNVLKLLPNKKTLFDGFLYIYSRKKRIFDTKFKLGKIK